MNRKDIEIIIKKHPYFQLNTKENELKRLIKTIDPSLSLSDILGAHITASTLFKIEGVIITVQGIHFSKDIRIDFKDLMDAYYKVNTKDVYLKYKDSKEIKLVDLNDKGDYLGFLKDIALLNQPKEINLDDYYQKGLELYRNQQYKEAYPYLLEVAKAGNRMVQCFVGYLVTYGYAGQKDPLKGLEWYEKSASQNYKDGSYYAADAIFTNKIESKYAQAMNYYENAANQGHAKSMYRLAYYYLFENKVDKDIHKAFYWAKKGVENNQNDCRALLGYLYFLDAFKDYNQGFELLFEASKKGSKYAKYLLGFYGAKNLIELSKEELELIYQYASEVKNEYNLTTQIQTIKEKLEKMKPSKEDIKKQLFQDALYYEKVKIYDKAIDVYLALIYQFYDKEASYRLGLLYYEGMEERELDFALYFLEEAATQYYFPAIEKLADICIHDPSSIQKDLCLTLMDLCEVQHDHVETKTLMEYHRLFKYHLYGIEHTSQEALTKKYQFALLYDHMQQYYLAYPEIDGLVDAGYAPAYALLASYYHHGIEVKKDFNEARKYYRLSEDELSIVQTYLDEGRVEEAYAQLIECIENKTMYSKEIFIDYVKNNQFKDIDAKGIAILNESIKNCKDESTKKQLIKHIETK